MPVSFYNASGEAIPPYACMEVTDAQDVTSRYVVEVSKPTGDTNEAGYLFNGPTSIPASKTGMGYTASDPAWSIYDTGSSPVNGEEWGPISGSWEIGPTGLGFIIVGGANGGKVIVRSFCSASTTTQNEGCGGCSTTSGDLTVDLGGGLICSDRYYISPICNGFLPITLEHDTGDEWDGGVGLEADCDGGPVAVTATLTISGTAVGDVILTISDGTNTWTWQNDYAFLPDLPVVMRRMTGPVDCPCSSWVPYPCLFPLDAV